MSNKQKKRTPIALTPPPNCKYLALTQNQIALVDEDIYPSIEGYNWQSGRETNNKYYPRVYNPKSIPDELLSLFPTRLVKLHTLVLHLNNIYVPQGMDCDHINGDTLDNRLCNLRVVTRKANLANPTNKRRPEGLYKQLGLAQNIVHNRINSINHILMGYDNTKWDWKKLEDYSVFAGEHLQKRINTHTIVRVVQALTSSID